MSKRRGASAHGRGRPVPAPQGRYTARVRVVDRRVGWWGPLFNVSGYADEARHFVHNLRAMGTDLAARSIGLDSAETAAQIRIGSPDMARSLAIALQREIKGAPVNVLHVTGDLAGAGPHDKVNVVRTMFETDRIPDLWVEQLNTVDEIWVPSAFNVETFRRSGVTTRIEVVPSGVDTDVLRPDLERLAVPGAHGTMFLSVLEWSYRKAPDVLLSAWAEAFGPDDDTSLVLRAFPRGHFGPEDCTAEIEGFVDKELERVGSRRADVASIVVLGRHLPPTEMARLMASSDVYLSPTRGEGWGRPLIEAMACGRPVIATRWSGQTDFLDDRNSLPVEIDGLVEVDERMDIGHYWGHRWAEPSRAHLVERMRWAAAHRAEREALGRVARADAVDKWQWSATAKVAHERLEDLLDGAAAAHRQASKPAGTAGGHQSVRWVGDVDALHSLARANKELLARLRTMPALSIEVAAPRGAGHSTTGSAGVEVRHHWPTNLGPAKAGTAVVALLPWELGVVPASWVAPIIDNVDEVWAYTSYVRGCFIRAGIAPEMVHVVPLGADRGLFRPDGPSFALRTTKSVKFLYVGGTIQRKGFDIALQSYVQTFSAADDVCLVVKPFLSDQHYKTMNLDADLSRAACVPGGAEIEVVEDTNLSDTELASLYRSCDVLLAPYRGEGFGLHILEAMASGTPAIVTGYGACLDFADNATSWLVPATEAPVDMAGMVPAVGRFSWAEPDRAALAVALRSAAAGPAERFAKAASSLERSSGFTWETSAAAVANRLGALRDRTPKASSRAARSVGNNRPLVSACMIVKDEQDHLGACLASVRGLADEIVIGDTGSSDATKDIAGASGATVLDVAWDDDFSKARNEVLARCRGRWIFWVDADERFEGDVGAVRSQLARATSEGLLVPIENIEGNGIEGATHHSAVRIFRRGMHWAGRVHEQVVGPYGSPVKTARLGGARLVHLGYTNQAFVAKDKRSRNLRLAGLALADAKPGEARLEAEMNLGRSLLLSGDPRSALEHLSASGESTVGIVARASLHTAVLAALSLPDLELAGRLLERLRSHCESQAMCDELAGIIAYNAGQWSGALAWFARLNPARLDDERVLRGMSDVASYAAKCHRALGQRSAAADVALGEIREHGRYQEHLGAVIDDLVAAGRDPAELGRVLPTETIKLWLAQLLQVAPDVALRVVDGAVDANPGSLVPLAAGGTIARKASVAKALEWSARLAARGIDDRPLMHIARDVTRTTSDRALAAATMLKVFGGDEPARLLSEMSRELDGNEAQQLLMLAGVPA